MPTLKYQGPDGIALDSPPPPRASSYDAPESVTITISLGGGQLLSSDNGTLAQGGGGQSGGGALPELKSPRSPGQQEILARKSGAATVDAHLPLNNVATKPEPRKINAKGPSVPVKWKLPTRRNREEQLKSGPPVSSATLFATSSQSVRKSPALGHGKKLPCRRNESDFLVPAGIPKGMGTMVTKSKSAGKKGKPVTKSKPVTASSPRKRSLPRANNPSKKKPGKKKSGASTEESLKEPPEDLLSRKKHASQLQSHSAALKPKPSPHESSNESQIMEKVVSVVVEMVADEIRYNYAPLFSPKPLNTKIEEGSLRKKMPAAAAPTANMVSKATVISDTDAVVMAVKRFVFEVYCPFLIAAKHLSGNNAPSDNRIRISTLLALREMLIMNAKKFFQFSHFDSSSSILLDERESLIYLSRVMADAIVRNVAKRFHTRYPSSKFFPEFMQATRDYHGKSEEFQFALDHADAQCHSEHYYHDGSKVGKEESVLSNVSFNYARARHPLVDFAAQDPLPTTCAAFQIETSAAIEEEEEEEEEESESAILDSFRELLRSKHWETL